MIRMKKIPTLLLSVTLFSLCNTLTYGAELFSPPLVPDGDNVLDCYLVNVSNQSRNVTIQVFNRAGVAITTVTTTLAPGQEDVARAESSLQPRYCRFDVDGKRSHFRASVLIRQDGVGAISALSAE